MSIFNEKIDLIYKRQCKKCAVVFCCFVIDYKKEAALKSLVYAPKEAHNIAAIKSLLISMK